jgi:hypothetical protein
MERPPGAIHACSSAVVHCNGSQFRSAVLHLFRPLWHLACLCHVGGSNEVLRRTYGKDNRVLHTAKLSQGFKVVPPSRTWQGVGVSTGGTKIGVTAPETRTAKPRLAGLDRSALPIGAYLWPPAPLQCYSASRCVPLSFDAALAFPAAELNFSRPIAGDTKTKEFEKVAT